MDVDFAPVYLRQLRLEDMSIIVIICSAFFHQNKIGFTAGTFNPFWFLNNRVLISNSMQRVVTVHFLDRHEI